jgi:hypothetical protein
VLIAAALFAAAFALSFLLPREARMEGCDGGCHHAGRC